MALPTKREAQRNLATSQVGITSLTRALGSSDGGVVTGAQEGTVEGHARGRVACLMAAARARPWGPPEDGAIGGGVHVARVDGWEVGAVAACLTNRMDARTDPRVVHVHGVDAEANGTT